MCHVLAVLGDGEESMGETLRVAVDLAESEHARLTLVKTCDEGRAYVWVAPFAVSGAYLPPVLASPEEAGRILASVVEQVPYSIPVTMRVLGSDTQRALLNLLRSGQYGALVADGTLLSHCWRLRRQLRRDEVQTIRVNRRHGEQDAVRMATQSTSSGVTEDGAIDADQISEGRGRRHFGLRPRFARRLAGAGGEH